MLVIDKTVKGIKFANLDRGDCFIYDGDHFMKCDRDNLALNLEIGQLWEFEPLEEVVPLKATLTAE